MNDFKGIIAGTRTNEGGFEAKFKCSFCNREEVTILAVGNNKGNRPVLICKGCATDAVAAIDGKFLETMREE